MIVARGPIGPDAPALDEDDCAPELVRLWAESSRQMQALCAARGIRYVHALQPNQYVPESKPMRPGERAHAVSAKSPFRVPVEEGYPLLRQFGLQLAAEGVAFHDLSRVFEDVDEPLYVDNCCHVSERGSQLLAQALAAAIIAEAGR